MADDGEPVEEVALSISAAANSHVNVDEQLDRIDALSLRCHDFGVAGDSSSLCRFLFSEPGFRGNRQSYYDPRNSYLDLVLTRRVGIPITLSVIAMAVGRRVGVDLVGVGMPGHFIVRDRSDAEAFYDPFNDGRAVDLAGCEQLFATMHGSEAGFSAEMVEPVDGVAIAKRMLANLTRAHLAAKDLKSLAAVLRLRTAVPGADPVVHRQLAGLLAHLGRTWEAAEIFERLIGLEPARAAAHRGAAQRLRADQN